MLRRQDAEQLARLPQRRDERVDVVDVVIDVKRRARGRRNAKAPHQRLRAVVPGADADAVAIQNRGEIVRMDVAVREWNDPRAVVAGAVHGNPLDLTESLYGDPGELLLVLCNAVEAELLEIRDRRAEPDRCLHVR